MCEAECRVHRNLACLREGVAAWGERGEVNLRVVRASRAVVDLVELPMPEAPRGPGSRRVVPGHVCVAVPVAFAPGEGVLMYKRLHVSRPNKSEKGLYMLGLHLPRTQNCNKLQ